MSAIAPIHPFQALRELAQDDPEYAWALHCNIAIPIMDELRCTHEQANRASARVIKHWFGVDIDQHEHWKTIERQWSECSPPSDETEHGA